jgi:hypothetical protein
MQILRHILLRNTPQFRQSCAILGGMNELETAREKLKAHGGYSWLLDGPAFWSVKEVIEELAKNGRRVSVSTVTRWFRDLPHTQGTKGPGGFSASKNDLILFFADQMGPRNRRSE